MNIGVLGGTFDPVHNGHLILADVAEEQLDLNEMLFIPAGQPWLKTERIVTPAQHRLHMLRLALDDRPHFRISEMEIERPGPTYTIDTISALKGGLNAGDELFFILGQDSLMQIPQWYRAKELVQLCYLAAAPRPGVKKPDFKALEAEIPGIKQRIMLMKEPKVDINATDIRERVARGLSVRHLVPEPVNRYIKEQKLYID
ncbi:MAG: nicotinate-nucleotide adenylyltransferase [Dehalococcoidia bacterium SG8_51_3]|nr:MAG: nicotinate-nucleotide adenylyltransferase [Dehalococcoidia bacterium SG8_51_3]